MDTNQIVEITPRDSFRIMLPSMKDGEYAKVIEAFVPKDQLIQRMEYLRKLDYSKYFYIFAVQDLDIKINGKIFA
jgi:hypothetical protein